MDHQSLAVNEDRTGSLGGPVSVPQFRTTEWSVILAAKDGDLPAADAALQRLCRVYWYPLYAYVRRRGHLPEDAEDLTQDFFKRLLERNGLASVHPEKGRFRSFLLASMNNFLANEWDRVKAEKRGGKVSFVSLNDESPETRYVREEVPDLSAERSFQRRWAIALLQGARLRGVNVSSRVKCR
ncbi:MAG: hypothetical protein L0Z50_37145 [Verrucomicrobiales bacterium]|nr:hypothetical protein [Verrucomicrobiales bacterium]